MQINRDNYESWFLDYLEGNLAEGMIDEFIGFIHENPDLREELRLFQPVTLEKSDVTFPGKNKLFRENLDLTETFDETAVAFLEGDLDQASASAFQDYLKQHPEKNREISLFNSTKLKPDTAINFGAKKKLYHTSVFRMYSTPAMQIAAVIVLALLFFPLLEKQPEKKDAVKKENYFSGNVKTVHTETIAAAENIPAKITVPAAVRTKIKHKEGTIKKVANPLTPARSGNPSFSDLSGRKDIPGLLSSIDLSPVMILSQHEPEIAVTSPSVVFYAESEPMAIPLSEKIVEKIGLANIRLDKIARWGLTLVTELSHDKFSFTTGPGGDITAYNLDTRLLGLSIPIRKKTEN